MREKKFKNYLWYATLPVTTTILVAMNVLGWIPVFWIAAIDVMNVLFTRFEWWTADLKDDSTFYSTPWDKSLKQVWKESINRY